jgi:hypothetical protein
VLLAMGPLTVRYDRLRVAQKAAIVVAERRPPCVAGTERETWEPTWADTFDRGVHEFADVPMLGNIPAEPSGPSRLRRLAARPDVWLPDMEQLRQAHADLSLGLAELRARRAEQAKWVSA